jgi:hypothetical protein
MGFERELAECAQRFDRVGKDDPEWGITPLMQLWREAVGEFLKDGTGGKPGGFIEMNPVQNKLPGNEPLHFPA